jgi:hypothetical protein
MQTYGGRRLLYEVITLAHIILHRGPILNWQDLLALLTMSNVFIRFHI